MPWQIQTVLLVVIGGAQIFLRSFSLKVSRIVYWLTVAGSFVWASYISRLQYISWEEAGIGKLLLPPHESIFYFIQYVGWRFFSPVIAVFVFSSIFILLAKFLNKRGEEKFFGKDEIYIAAMAMVNSGYPQIFAFFVSFTFIFLVANVVKTVKSGGGSRTSPYYLWIPAALIAILISRLWLLDMPWWNLLIM